MDLETQIEDEFETFNNKSWFDTQKVIFYVFESEINAKTINCPERIKQRIISIRFKQFNGFFLFNLIMLPFLVCLHSF